VIVTVLVQLFYVTFHNMTLSRRDFLKLTSLVAASAALSSCAPRSRQLLGELAQDLPALNPADFQALNRLTFGARPADRARVAEVGLHDWIEEQLAPDSIDDFACHVRLRNLDSLTMSAQQLADMSNKLFDDIDRKTVPTELRQGTLIRQVFSRRQLYEVLVEFWNDHFNISTDKGNCFYLKTVDDREVARAHALGSFRDLLWASAHSPAMLTYLDNQANHKGAPNENYARELMELHTLSVRGGYGQQDVMELARCLTGWTVKERFWAGDFTFDNAIHDPGEKVVLGLRIPPGGQAEAESVVERLSKHPSTAKFISEKLARRFLADEPPAAIVAKAAAVFENSNGDIRSTLRVILLDGLRLAKVKFRRPVNFVAASLRMLNAESDCGAAVQDYLLRMGQVPFNWPTPDGYPDRSESWQGNLMPRWQFAFALVQNELGRTEVDLPALMSAAGRNDLPSSLDSLSTLLLGAPLPMTERDNLIASVRSAGGSDDELLPVLAGGILASPAFQWR
jgi:uncharacterized protein (DUF1800 family)